MTLADRLGQALAEGMRRDVVIQSGDGPLPGTAPPAAPIPAAVLVAVTDRAEPGVILTQRPETMRAHPGQVAFPGGRRDPGEDAVAAARREAQEEVALDPALVAVVGMADPYLTVTGYRIEPVVAVIPPDLPLVPSEAEVAAVFEVPLAFLLDPANHRRETMTWRGATREYWEIPWQDRRIWGATAAMIVNLSRRLAWH